MHEGWEAVPTGCITWTINAPQGGRIDGFRCREAENPAICSLLNVDAERSTTWVTAIALTEIGPFCSRCLTREPPS
jgi:hypothetical protein